ncbi:MAG TPA: TonB-dependent receptor plug domain-containing protein, partial [Bacteroidia bacterium]|nr:TonB-dependent receptor plug domain-containing protein [Bacteroidia bacterium]
LDAVDILKARMEQSGVRRDITDSTIARLYPAGTLTDLLGGGGVLTLKSYTAGGLSTMSIRGANSMQTPVVWNGINLQNTNNNTVDLSLLPVFLFDQVAVQPGSSSAAWGSGAIGGVIKLTSLPRDRSSNGNYLRNPYLNHKVVFEYGSFGANMFGVKVGGGKGQWTYDLKLYRQHSLNNFWFTNTSFAQPRRQQLNHATMRQQGFMTEVYFDPKNPNNQFVLRMWVQETHREIPPTMLQSVNEATQKDYACRIMSEWFSFPTSRIKINTRAAVIHEGLLYNPGFSQPINNTNAWTYIAESEMTYDFGQRDTKVLNNLRLSGGLNAMYATSEVTESIPHKEQLRMSMYASIGKALRESDEFNITVRDEIIDGKMIDPVGSIWYYLSLKKWLAIRTCVSHSYRVPTFNDLYWTPGGNPDLLPETSWTEEITVDVRPRWKTGYISYSVTAYNRNVKDMITWVPNAAFWSPLNVAEVWSRGMEHRLKYFQAVSRWKFTFLANADYVRSTYEKTNTTNDVSIGKQLIYVPAWFGGATATAQWKDYFITYAHQYTDLRFTTRDHVEWLPAYSIANLAVGWNWKSNLNGGVYWMNLFFRCNNIFDEQYESMAWRPMPGRSYMIGFSIDFSKQKEITE